MTLTPAQVAERLQLDELTVRRALRRGDRLEALYVLALAPASDREAAAKLQEAIG